MVKKLLTDFFRHHVWGYKHVRLLKQSIVALLMFFCLGSSMQTFAQDNPWFFGLHTRSNSVWTNDILSVRSMVVNTGIAPSTEGALYTDLIAVDYHYVKLEDNGEEVDFKQNNPYGFTAYDLFNDLEVGFKVGWQGAETPIGLYVYGAYGINQYKLRFLGERDYSKHKLQSVRMGVGVKISPLRFMLLDYGWCPIIELGTTYVNNFKYKGPNGNDKDQINNGMRSSYAIGVQFGERGNYSIMLGMDMLHYDIFNRNYTPDGGFWYPYANFSSKDMNFNLSFCLNLW